VKILALLLAMEGGFYVVMGIGFSWEYRSFAAGIPIWLAGLLLIAACPMILRRVR
jgi:hypothetical protein